MDRYVTESQLLPDSIPEYHVLPLANIKMKHYNNNCFIKSVNVVLKLIPHNLNIEYYLSKCVGCIIVICMLLFVL